MKMGGRLRGAKLVECGRPLENRYYTNFTTIVSQYWNKIVIVEFLGTLISNQICWILLVQSCFIFWKKHTNSPKIRSRGAVPQNDYVLKFFGSDWRNMRYAWGSFPCTPASNWCHHCLLLEKPYLFCIKDCDF